MTMRVTPRLVVAGASAAIEFYKTALGAREIERFADERSGKVFHAALALGGDDGAAIAVVDELREYHNDAPTSLGGSPVILHLDCDDPDALAARMVAAGATVVFAVRDHDYGAREGRVRDPYGHLWIVSRKLG